MDVHLGNRQTHFLVRQSAAVLAHEPARIVPRIVPSAPHCIGKRRTRAFKPSLRTTIYSRIPADYLSCHRFRANAFRLLLHSLALFAARVSAPRGPGGHAVRLGHNRTIWHGSRSRTTVVRECRG